MGPIGRMGHRRRTDAESMQGVSWCAATLVAYPCGVLHVMNDSGDLHCPSVLSERQTVGLQTESAP